MDLKLQNKIVLVTGSSKGIGFQIAKSYLEEGSKVIITSRKDKNLNNAQNILEKLNYKNRYILKKVDFTKEKSIKELKQFLNKKKINLDILINNLGNGKGYKDKIPDIKIFTKSLDVNFKSAVMTSKIFIDSLVKNKGQIVFVSSIVSLEILEAPIEYSISKTAINAFSKSISIKYGSKIRINTVVPGNIFFKDGTWDKKLKLNKNKVMEYINKNVPQKKFGMPEDVANLILFLTSDKANFINGSTIVIDGGQNKSFY